MFRYDRLHLKILKYAAAVGGIFVVAVACFKWRIDPDAGLCRNQVLGSYPSPDGSKKVVLFVRDCGATTDWSVAASILMPAEELHDTDQANIFVADADHGAAAESNAIGGPAVRAAWKSSNELEIQYSRGARIFLEIPQSSATHVIYSSF